MNGRVAMLFPSGGGASGGVTISPFPRFYGSTFWLFVKFAEKLYVVFFFILEVNLTQYIVVQFFRAASLWCHKAIFTRAGVFGAVA